MSNPVVRLAFAGRPGPAAAGQEVSRGEQLSLFDYRPAYRLLCLPMVELHGNSFVRLVEAHRPTVVLDARAYPYFDLTNLDRERAFRLFANVAARYVHRHIDLRRPDDQGARWRVRGATIEALEALVDAASAGGTFAVLTDRASDASVLQEATRHSEPSRPVRWLFQTHDGARAADP